MSTVSSTTTATGATGATKIVWSSNAADIDWSALVEASVAAKTARADSIDVKISSNEAKAAAYQTLQDLLQDVADAAQALRAPSGYTAASADVFQDRTAYLSATGGIDATDYLGVAVDEGTDPASYSIGIVQLATAHKVAGGAQSSKYDDLGLAGSFSLGLAGGGSAAIAVTATMSLAEIAEAVNLETAVTGVKATVLQVAAGDYRLVLTAAETGRAIETSAVSGTDILATLGVTDGAGAFVSEVQAARPAILTIDGLTVTRSTNTIDDAVEGVTFYLYDVPDAASTMTVEVVQDTGSVADAVQALVDAYNAYREFAYAQQAVTSAGTASSDAVLFGDGTLRSINASLAAAFGALIDESSMALIGLSFDSDNTLVLDTDTLAEALESDYAAVQSLLAFSMTTSSDDIGLIARGTSAPAAFVLDVTVDESGTLAAAGVGGDTSLFTISGNRIKGAAGTAYEGLTFVFTGSASQSISIGMGQGIAERLYNVAATATADADDGGTLARLIADLQDANATLETKADEIRSRAEDYRTRLTARYAAYQAAIEAAQSTLDYLDALLNASSD